MPENEVSCYSGFNYQDHKWNVNWASLYGGKDSVTNKNSLGTVDVSEAGGSIAVYNVSTSLF